MNGPDRLKSGVRVRVNGCGDPWANEHRQQLGGAYLMQDIDAVFGVTAFGHNTGERLFLEYVPDDWANRGKCVRTFAAVAMFDRKSTEQRAFSDGNALSTAFYLWLCRKLSQGQPKEARFFFVIGGGSPPWTMIELGIHDAARKEPSVVLDNANMEKVWRALGLTALRRELHSWVKKL